MRNHQKRRLISIWPKHLRSPDVGRSRNLTDLNTLKSQMPLECNNCIPRVSQALVSVKSLGLPTSGECGDLTYT